MTWHTNMTGGPTDRPRPIDRVKLVADLTALQVMLGDLYPGSRYPAVIGEAILELTPAKQPEKVWCVTCQHTHIAAIPEVTHQCHSCGWGQWRSEDAAAHEVTVPGHATFPVRHVLVPLSDLDG